MELSIIEIGNSKGIKLPKIILEQYSIGDKVELILEKTQIVIKPKTNPRKNWKQTFMQMHENGDDQLLIDDVFSGEFLEE